MVVLLLMPTLRHSFYKLLFPLNLGTSVSLSTELVRLSVSPKIMAECGKQVTLHCNVSSSRDGLLIKHMKWYLNKTSLCSVDSEGNVINHQNGLSDFNCEYKHGQLSLVFRSVQPLESGNSKPYMCKLQSNKGAGQAYTSMELQGQSPHLFSFR